MFCGAVIRAVHKYAGILRAVIATASNDHRLGANEAPPAIISIFLGEQLTDVFEQIKAGGAKSSKMKSTLEIGVDTLPKLPRDAGDRNRTSPFAFTGNRFEFRAVGSSQSIGDPLVALNTIIAESLDYVATKLEAALAGGKKLNAAIQEVLAEIITEHGAVCFDGNGYSAEWHAEAEKRGLPNYKTAVDALPVLQQKEVDRAVRQVQGAVAARAPRPLRDLPRAVQQERQRGGQPDRQDRQDDDPPGRAAATRRKLAENAIAVKAAGLTPDTTVLKQVTDLIGKLQAGLAGLETAVGHHGGGDALAEAKHFGGTVLPAMLKVREAADSLEGVVDDDLWPLPTFQEILFIK